MLWLKAFHIIGVVSWFAALLYLPRLFVYHSQIQRTSQQGTTVEDDLGNARFKIMERKLFMIMTIGALIAIGFGVAMLKLRFALDVEMFDIVDGISARMRARGHAPGSAVEMISDIRVEDLAPGRVRLRWKAASQVTGALTGVGSRIMDGVARKLTSQFWENFADRVAREAA